MTVDLVTFALPSGRTGTTGRCTVLFAPRIRLDEGKVEALEEYADWKDWPAALAQLTLQVRVNETVVPHAVVSPAPQSAVWNAVFAPTTPVEPHVVGDRRLTNPISYNGVALEQRLRDALGALADRVEPAGSFADLAGVPAVAALLDSPARGQVERFFEPVGQFDVGGVPTTVPDFHGWLTLVSSYPALLRALGLAVDLEVNLAAAGSQPTVVQVATTYSTFPNRREASPIMQVTSSFLAAADPEPDRNEVDEGWLRCGDPQFSFARSDGAAIVADLGRQARDQPDDAAATGIPAGAGEGLALTRADAPQRLLARWDRQQEVEDELSGAFGNPTLESHPLLWAEDVVVGYRFDIFDATADTWRSLYERTPAGPFQLPRDPAAGFVPPPDEGIATPVLSLDGEETQTVVPEIISVDPPVRRLRTVYEGEVRVDPAVVSWWGWSNATLPPRRVFDTEIEGPVDKPASEPAPAGPVRLAIEHVATPGSLPRLRYGRTYIIRGRVVDLAGNSLPPTPGSTTMAPTARSESVLFSRLRPIPAPLVIWSKVPPVPRAGEAVDTLVLRSDYDIDDATVDPDERVVVPAPSRQWTCELHGRPGGGIQPAAYAELAARDDATLEGLTTFVDGERLWGSGDAESYVPGDPTTPVPYLSDPGAAGVAFAVVGFDTVLTTPWGASWPGHAGGRLVVRAGAAAPQVRPSADVLARISVPKAVRGVLELSSTPDGGQVDRFFAAGALAGNPALAEAVARGRHQMVSARRRVNVVHAVRRPLTPPVPNLSGVEREAGETAGPLVGTVGVNGPSTGALVAHATWTEIVDDPADPAGPAQHQRATRGSRGASGSDGAVTDLPSLELGSTKRAELSVTIDAVTDFLEYFEEAADVLLRNGGAVVDAAGLVASRVTVRYQGRVLRRGVHYEIEAVAGRVRRIPQGDVPNNSTVTVTYVARPVIRSSTELGESGTATFTVPSTVVPPPPVVADVVPAFVERRRSTGQRVDVVRSGTAVRIWLERPWFATGAGEQLAVVLDGPDPQGRSVLARHAAQLEGAPTTPLGPASLPPDAQVISHDGRTMVLLDVAYDADRQRWFAELELRGDLGYRPWLRLVVARWQVDAIDGAKLSGLVFAQPLRLGLRRALTARRRGRRIAVLVAGPDHAGVLAPGGGGPLANEVVVRAQVADDSVADPDLRWADTDVELTLERVREGRWEGLLEPTGAMLSGAPTRLVVTESEPSPGPAGGGDVVRPVVHAETVDVPAAWLPRPPGLAPGQPG